MLDNDPAADHDLAADFATFCTRDAPQPEEWILLDADLPPGTHLALGTYTLATPTHTELIELSPLPKTAARDDEAGVLPPGPLQGAAFLRSAKPDQALVQGLRVRWPYGSTTDLKNWLPLYALLLWSPDITRAEAVFEVEPGRHIARTDGEPAIWESVFTTSDGQPHEYMRHHKQGMTLTDDQLAAFASFTGSVLERTLRILDLNVSKRDKVAKAARRLQRAGQHLVRAAHRTHGSAEYQTVSEYEQNEVVLLYVIALAALLADDENLDLSRKVRYRAAALFGSGDERERVSRIVKTTYDTRSKYAHGDDPGHVDIDELRRVTRQVILRWLILATDRPSSTSAPQMVSIPSDLDSASLSNIARHDLILGPLQTFFRKHPPADPPRDLASESFDGHPSAESRHT